MAQNDWSQARNLLCVRLDSLGDVLMTSPALRALKVPTPGRRLTLLTSPGGAAAARLLPEVDAIIVYRAPWLKASPARSDGSADLAMAAMLRARAFDGAVIFTVYSQNPLPSALLCHLADIPRRLAHCRENPYQLLTDWVPETEPHGQLRHEVRRQLDLVAAIGASADDERLRLRVPRAARTQAANALAQAGVALQRPWLVIHPGASAAARRYPPERFAAVARRLIQEDCWQVVFTGSAAERALIEGIQSAIGAPSFSVAGRLTLGALAALIAHAPLLISNNTGPAHIACAAGTPVVDLYALTNPQHTPWGVPHRVLYRDVPCKYCYKSVCPQGHHACLRGVDAHEVVAAARAVLAETAPVLRPGRAAESA